MFPRRIVLSGDWFGEPWRKPEVAVLIHGNDESSVVWYGWVPRMAQEFRLLRRICRILDNPGFRRVSNGRCRVLRVIARVLDKAGVEAAHIIGAKLAARLRCSLRRIS